MQDDITYIGLTDWRHIRKRFGIRDADSAFHSYLIGKTGTGKSTLILNMTIQDIQRGKAVAVFDPHSDLVERLLKYIPEHRVDDVVYFNATDTEFPIAFNPLADIHPKYHHLVAAGLISTFKKLFTNSWGANLEHTLRFTIHTLLEAGESTLLDIPPLLTDQDFRSKVLSRIKNPRLLAFWKNENIKGGFRSESVSPILNKFGIFISSAPLRNIFGQAKSAFRMQQILDEGKILIVNVCKGIIGEDACTMLGSVLVTAMQNAVLFRATQKEELRRPFYAYIDEFQSFASTTFCDALSESRKYGLSLFLAHQYIDQLKDQIPSAIFGNVGTIMSFRIGVNDARHLAKEFHPVFDESDIVNLPKYSFYIKMMIDGTVSKPFSAISLPLPDVTVSYKDEIVARSRAKYAKAREAVDNEILYGVQQKGNGITSF